EGTLHWVPRHEVLQKQMSQASRFILQRYFQEGLTDQILIGTLGNDGGRASIAWAPLADWE
ncbi:MAG: NUDIX hydrolase, partial [Firmicutes bacterium]|nr:NUDIX hydrolase [Bacillota bacterium]